MRTFKVTVMQKSIKVSDYTVADHRIPDYVALVDGERFQYFLERDKNVMPNTDWWGRALNHIHYHAGNSGYRVVWLPRHEVARYRKKEISKHQLSLLQRQATYHAERLRLSRTFRYGERSGTSQEYRNACLVLDNVLPTNA